MRKGLLTSRVLEPKDEEFKDKTVREGLRYVALLKACARMKDVHKGSKLHSEILRQGLLEKNPYIASTVIRYAEHGQGFQALDCFEQMQNEGLSPNVVTYICTLKACSCVGDIQKEAHEILEEIPVRNIVSWNALIAGYILHNQCDKALDCFELVRNEGLLPNDVTFIDILKAYGDVNDIDRGKEVHSSIEKRGLLGMQGKGNIVNH